MFELVVVFFLVNILSFRGRRILRGIRVAQEDYFLCNYFSDGYGLILFIGPFSGMQGAFNEDEATFREIFEYAFSLFFPGDNSVPMSIFC